MKRRTTAPGIKKGTGESLSRWSTTSPGSLAAGSSSYVFLEIQEQQVVSIVSKWNQDSLARVLKTS
jgi:hypothetical protein